MQHLSTVKMELEKIRTACLYKNVSANPTAAVGHDVLLVLCEGIPVNSYEEIEKKIYARILGTLGSKKMSLNGTLNFDEPIKVGLQEHTDHQTIKTDF